MQLPAGLKVSGSIPSEGICFELRFFFRFFGKVRRYSDAFFSLFLQGSRFFFASFARLGPTVTLFFAFFARFRATVPFFVLPLGSLCVFLQTPIVCFAMQQPGKYRCGCGALISNVGKAKREHFKSDRHQKWVKSQQTTKTLSAFFVKEQKPVGSSSSSSSITNTSNSYTTNSSSSSNWIVLWYMVFARVRCTPHIWRPSGGQQQPSGNLRCIV